MKEYYSVLKTVIYHEMKIYRGNKCILLGGKKSQFEKATYNMTSTI